ncbi:MAG TPA: phosphatidate cytidylyltransferase [Dongiaceae bacterium]|nr:phosphatidate cytidylyltransferase [Dongiaceae bacterium]
MAPPAEPTRHLGEPAVSVARPSTSSHLTSLQKRVLSAAVLLPLAVVALWFGDRAWNALIFLFALSMAWEWCAICGKKRPEQVPYPSGAVTLPLIVMLATVAVALLPSLVPISGNMFWPPNIATIVAGAVLACVAAWPHRGMAALWFGLGVVYVVPASLAAIAIRAQPSDGLATEIWIVALVVAADTGAYIAGRSIGGPKLAPRISPSKTWAGLFGAVVSAGLVGCVTAIVVARPSPLPLVLVSGMLALVEQAGDLFESFLKRHFGVKDSGRIIPGHGGVLDRVDGLLAVILAVAGLEFIMGEGILAWL